MARRHEAADWRDYRMDWRQPHRQLEPLEREVAAVNGALAALARAGVLDDTRYDEERFRLFREAVARSFEIPWSAISRRMQRLLYATNAIAKPRVAVAVGIFCGYTFACNAGAAAGPGKCYDAERLVGIEIDAKEAARARRNLAAVGAAGVAEVVAADGISWLAAYDGAIDLLYLDANGGGKGKSIYLDLLKAALHSLKPGSLVLAHNSVNSSAQLADYLAFVRDARNFRQSVNVILDNQGLEVSSR